MSVNFGNSFSAGLRRGQDMAARYATEEENTRRWEVDQKFRQAGEARAQQTFDDSQAELAHQRGIRTQTDALRDQLLSPNKGNYSLAAGQAPGMRMEGFASNLDAPQAPAQDVEGVPPAPTADYGLRAPVKAAPVLTEPKGGYTANQAPTRGAASEILGKMALLKGDTDGYSKAQTEKRGFDFQDAFGAATSEFASMKPEDKVAMMERITEDHGFPLNSVLSGSKDKNGKPMYTTWVEGKPRVKASESDVSEIYAAQKLMRDFPELAAARLEKGSKNVRQLYKDFVELQDKQADTNNQATHFANQDANNAARLGIAAQGARDAAQAARMGLVRTYNDPQTGQIKEVYPVTGRDGKVKWEEVPTPAGMEPYSAKKQGFEKLPEDGTRVRDVRGNVMTYMDGVPVLANGIAPSARAKTLPLMGLPAQAEAMLSFLPGQQHVIIVGDTPEDIYDMSNKHDVTKIKVRLNELASREVNEGEAAARLAAGDTGQGRRGGVLHPRYAGLSAADAALETHRNHTGSR